MRQPDPMLIPRKHPGAKPDECVRPYVHSPAQDSPRRNMDIFPNLAVMFNDRPAVDDAMRLHPRP